MRALIFELRPELLENDGLQGGAGGAGDVDAGTPPDRVDAELCDEPDVSIAMKEALYRTPAGVITPSGTPAPRAKVAWTACRMGSCWNWLTTVGFDPSGAFPGHLG